MQERRGNYSFTSPQKILKQYSNNIDDYEIHEILGKGGFGIVYRALSKATGSFKKEVAIKMIDKRKMKELNLTKRVANEVEIHWQLRHTSILELYNYFEDDLNVYLVMEICKQGELYKYLQKCKKLSEPETRGIMVQLLNGMKYLHSNGILHRDLKLSNILLSSDYSLKIADFGLAVKLSDSRGEQKTMCGTPNYISPEIVSRQPYGLSSDAWAVGCLMVTLLTGTPPFQSEKVKSTLDRVSKAEYSLPMSLSVSAREFIALLLQKDPSRRPLVSNMLSHEFFNGPMVALRPQSVLPEKVDQKIISLSSRNNQSYNNSKIISASSGKILIQSEKSFHNLNNSSNYSRSIGNQHKLSRTNNNENVPPNTVKKAEVLLPQKSIVQLTKVATPLPSFSTSRLSPRSQTTKHGTVSIEACGQVRLDFKGELYMIEISSDSQEIFLLDRQTMSAIFTYTKSHVPGTFVKKYMYAARFVDLVRTKTPKIIFYSPQAKCTLMENCPFPDFHVSFYNGVKSSICTARKTIEVVIPECLKFEISCEGGVGVAGGGTKFVFDLETRDRGLDGMIKDVLIHGQECLRQCLTIEGSTRFEKCTSFPMILKSAQYSANSSVMPSTPNANLTHFTINSQTPGSAARSINEKLGSIRSTKSNVTTNSVSSLNGGADLCSKFLVDVGWCVSTGDRQFIMMFIDGAQLTVHSRTQMVTYNMHNLAPQRYKRYA